MGLLACTHVFDCSPQVLVPSLLVICTLIPQRLFRKLALSRQGSWPGICLDTTATSFQVCEISQWLRRGPASTHRETIMDVQADTATLFEVCETLGALRFVNAGTCGCVVFEKTVQSTLHCNFRGFFLELQASSMFTCSVVLVLSSFQLLFCHSFCKAVIRENLPLLVCVRIRTHMPQTTPFQVYPVHSLGKTILGPRLSTITRSAARLLARSPTACLVILTWPKLFAHLVIDDDSLAIFFFVNHLPRFYMEQQFAELLSTQPRVTAWYLRDQKILVPRPVSVFWTFRVVARTSLMWVTPFGPAPTLLSPVQKPFVQNHRLHFVLCKLSDPALVFD